MKRKPEWRPIWLACAHCKAEWDDWQPAYCPIPTWVAHVKTYCCPKCGQGKKGVFIRQSPLVDDPMRLDKE